MRGRLAKLSLVAPLALLCAACPKGDGPGPEATAPAGASARPGGSAWTEAGGGSARTASTTEPGPRALPGIAWTNPVAREVLSEPVFARIGSKDAVLMSSNTEILAFDLESGKTLWSHECGSPMNASPAVIGDSVYALLMDAMIRRLSLADGALKKEYEQDFALEASPLVFDGRLVFEETSHSAQVVSSRLHAFDPATETDAWHFDYAKGAGQAPSSDGERIFVASHEGVRAVNAKDGTEAWAFAFPPAVRVYAPIVAGGVVTVIHGSYAPATVTALDPKTGAVRWTRTAASRSSAPPAASSTELFAPMMDDKIHRFALADGAEAPPIELGSRSDARPVLSPERLYVAVGQTVVAYDRATMKEAWRVELESMEVSTAGIVHMAVMGTKLVVVRLDGHVHALEAAGGS